ncbi:MAG: D-2-hydroxyacid dehydrogenase [Paenibacillaceae bacterium]|nr:D-2-hydroxyacid dehydrogenase [Paenibacillaceae bacterium]
MNIVVLDGYTLNPGDLSWERLGSLGSLQVYDRTAPEQIVERAAHAEMVLTNKTPLSAETIAKLPQLRYIGVLATGYNVVDVSAAAARGIPVTNVPDYGTGSVAQFAFALLLELCHRVQRHDDAVRNGEWAASPDFCFVRAPLVELEGKTLGVVGFGRIGQQTARIGAAFGMNVFASARSPKQLPGFEHVRWGSTEEVLREADVVSLHCPLTPETNRLIDRERIGWMKPTAFLINTSRGALVDDEALAEALNEGRLAGAGLDVLTMEPPAAGHALIGARNCIVTPHIAWATKEARARLLGFAEDNVIAYLRNTPVNVVNR